MLDLYVRVVSESVETARFGNIIHVQGQAYKEVNFLSERQKWKGT